MITEQHLYDFNETGFTLMEGLYSCEKTHKNTCQIVSTKQKRKMRFVFND